MNRVIGISMPKFICVLLASNARPVWPAVERVDTALRRPVAAHPPGGTCNRSPVGRIDHGMGGGEPAAIDAGEMGSSEPPEAMDADRLLVAAVLAGTRGAFETLVRDHQRLCWHIINRMVRHPDD